MAKEYGEKRAKGAILDNKNFHVICTLKKIQNEIEFPMSISSVFSMKKFQSAWVFSTNRQDSFLPLQNTKHIHVHVTDSCRHD